MDYLLEQLIDNCKNYQVICNLLFELVQTKENMIKMREILYEGRCGDFYFSSRISSHDNPFREAQRRIDMAYLLIKNPETFDVIVNEKVDLFHGTGANALPSILKYGLNSGLESEKNGIDIVTGETWSRFAGKQRDFVSFTDVLDIAYYYSEISNKENGLSFEVIVGTTVEAAERTGIVTVFSEVPEVGIRNKLPIDCIKVVCVPSDKIEFVQCLVNNDNLKVVALDTVGDRFYYIDFYSMSVNIDYDKFNKVKESLNSSKNSYCFKLEDIRRLMIERFLSLKKGFKEELFCGRKR